VTLRGSEVSANEVSAMSRGDVLAAAAEFIWLAFA
jgi:hypothetical protein